MEGSIVSDVAKVADQVQADNDRLVHELASAKGECIQLRKQLALVANEDQLASDHVRLQAEHAAALETIGNFDATINEILDLAVLESGDVDTAAYRLGKIHSICEAVPDPEQRDGDAQHAETD